MAVSRKQGSLIEYAEGRPVKGRVATEDEEQIAVIDWAAAVSGIYPALKLLKADANGGLRPSQVRYDKSGKAHRFSFEAQKLRRSGVRAGWPDLTLPSPVRNSNGSVKWCGLFIEMKRTEGGTLSEEQKQWLDALNQQGYVAVACKGFEAARYTILTYLSGGNLTMKGYYSILP